MKQTDSSADQILVRVQTVPHTLASVREASFGDDTAGIARRLGHARSVLHVRNLLHLSNTRGGGVLFTVVEGVVLLWDLQTEDGVADQGADKDERTRERGHLGPLQFEMHRYTRVWQLKVHILIDVTSRMREIVGDIVRVHVVVVDEAPSVLALRPHVEAYVVPVGWPHFVVGVLRVTEILGQGKGKRARLEQRHLPLEVLIFDRVILLLQANHW